MAQIKIYGLKKHLDECKPELSTAIHRCAVEVLELPAEKRFHRFIALDQDDFLYPDDRSEAYTLIEVSLFSGRTQATKKAFIRAMFDALAPLGILPQDLELTLFETPRENWGIRGKTGDELSLAYKVDI